MTSTFDPVGPTRGARAPDLAPAPAVHRGRIPTWVAVVAIALAAAAAWIPALTIFPSSDEGGYLLLASQWHPGSSLYGSYWVDRPPVLMLLFQFANVLGGVVGLRLVGIACVVTSVLLAGLAPSAFLPVGASARVRHRAAVLTALAAAALLATPLLGAMEVDGELLAVPAVLAGCLVLLRAQRSVQPAHRAALLTLAGLLGSAAWLTKQDVVDVFVLGAALAAAARLHDHRNIRGVLADLGWLVVGLVVGIAAALVVASAHGTSATGLWSAVVTFRLKASEVIASSASGANSQRFWVMLGAFALSAAPFVIWYAVRGLRGTIARGAPREGLRPTWPLLALLTWEVVGIAGGGSFWLHYLVGLVPGIVLLVAAAAAAQPVRNVRDGLVWAVTLAVASTVVAAPLAVSQLRAIRGDDRAVATYLSAHKVPGDTAVITYGHPDILLEAGLRSPYPYLWSLPARVLDPHLVALQHVLTADRPEWLVTSGGSVGGWGFDSSAARHLVRHDYRTVYTSGKWSVMQRSR